MNNIMPSCLDRNRKKEQNLRKAKILMICRKTVESGIYIRVSYLGRGFYPPLSDISDSEDKESEYFAFRQIC